MYRSARRINELGTLGGTYSTTGRNSINPATSDIGSAVGNHSSAYDVNDSGQATGSYFTGATQGRGYVTGPNAPINPLTDDMGALAGTTASSPRGINSNGLVVGILSTASESIYHAFLYDGVEIIDLNDIIDNSGAGWTLQVANSINDHGQIAGYGTINGMTRAFRLDPIPEPSTAAIVVCVALRAAIAKKRRSPRRQLKAHLDAEG